MLFVAFYQICCYGLTLYFTIKFDLSSSYKLAGNDYFEYFYNPPYSRVAPFTVGMLIGLLLYSFEKEIEEESILKKVMDAINNQLVIRTVMYILGITLLLTVYTKWVIKMGIFVTKNGNFCNKKLVFN